MFLAFLLLACDGTSGPEDGAVPEDGDVPEDAGARDATVEVDAFVPPCPDCPLALPAVRVENHAGARRALVRATLPFARGEVSDAARLAGYSVDGVPAELVPMQWHYDRTTGARHSVAHAQLRVPLDLAADEVRTLVPSRTGDPVPAYAAGAASSAWLAGTPDADAYVELFLPGDATPYRAPLFGGTSTVVQAGATTETHRYRAHFTRDGAAHPLSLTTYLTRDAGLDHGELVVLIGNDTLEQAIGGIDVDRVELVATAPFRFRLREPSAYGVTAPAESDSERWTLLGATQIADGAEVPFRGAWAVTDQTSSSTFASYVAQSRSPVFGVADLVAWQASLAAGPTGVLRDPRFSSVEEARAAVAASCTDAIVGASPFHYFGPINLNPPSTGDQPDFTSNVQEWLQSVLQTGSSCPLRPVQIAADREGLRPSFYWMSRGGAEDRVRAGDFPELFFWGGRVHFDQSWNSEYPAWHSRTSPFSAGDTHGWGAMDDQHYGNNTVRGVYTLTGDPYLRELLVAHQSLVYWMALTDYIESPGAERSMRLMKEAILLYAVDDEGPTAAELRRRTILRNTHVLAAVEASQTTYGNPCYGLVRNDARVTLTVGRPDQDVCMAWQTGFHMEYQALAIRNGWDPTTAQRIADLYLDAAPDFFASDGTPITYFLMSDPSVLETGGIGASWWAGWMHATEERPAHPQHGFLSSAVRTYLLGATEGTATPYWQRADAWRSFR